MGERRANTGRQPGIAAADGGGSPAVCGAVLFGRTRGGGVVGTSDNGAMVRGVIRGGIHWHVEPAWRERLPRPLSELLCSAETETVKHGPFRTVYRIRSARVDLHVKHCRPVGVRAWLRELLRPAKAVLEFRKIVALSARHVPTLEPVAWGKSAGPGPGDS